MNALTQLGDLLQHADDQPEAKRVLDVIAREGIPAGENPIRDSLRTLISSAQKNIAARTSEQDELLGEMQQHQVNAGQAESVIVQEEGRAQDTVITSADEAMNAAVHWGEAQVKQTDQSEEATFEQGNQQQVEELRRQLGADDQQA